MVAVKVFDTPVVVLRIVFGNSTFVELRFAGVGFKYFVYVSVSKIAAGSREERREWCERRGEWGRAGVCALGRSWFAGFIEDLWQCVKESYAGLR